MQLFSAFLHRKEVIQPHLPIRLPCYDFTPVIGLTLDNALLAVRLLASGAPNSHGVTGGVYKARERIHRDFMWAGCSPQSELGLPFRDPLQLTLSLPFVTAIVARV